MRRNIEALTLIESENTETPNIGTVTVGWNTREIVEQKIRHAIEAHFDCAVDELPPIDWDSLEGYCDTSISVNVGDYESVILIQRTVLY